MSVLFPSPSICHFSLFLSLPYTYQVMEAKKTREGLQSLTAADLPQLLSCARSSAAL